MPNPRLDAACAAYLTARGLPAAPADVAALAAFVSAEAVVMYGVAHGTQASALPGSGFKTGRMVGGGSPHPGTP